MNLWRPCPRQLSSILLVVMIGLPAMIDAGQIQSDSCILPTQHAGLTFPVEQVTPTWACRLQPVMSNYTTANKIGPIRTRLPEEVYGYLLDHPSMAANLVNRLDIALYQAAMQGPGRFWGSDGDGTEGLVELVYEDRTTRIYYLEGSHDGTLLPQVTGRAVVLLRMRPVTESNGADAVETTLVCYTQLNSRVLSGIMSLLRPLVGGVVTRQFMKAFEAADRLSQVMRHDPERVLFEATDPPSLPDEEVAFLKQALSNLRNPGGATETHTTL